MPHLNLLGQVRDLPILLPPRRRAAKGSRVELGL